MAHRTDAPGNQSGQFTDGDPGSGTPATVVGSDWLNDMQENLVRVVEGAGITPAKGDFNQLTQAINFLSGGSFKNLAINGTFEHWQRGASLTLPRPVGVAPFVADRWFTFQGGGGSAAATVSRQAFTPGQTAVPNSPRHYLNWDQTVAWSSLAATFEQRLPNVRGYSAKDITISFWAKVASGTLQLTPSMRQNFGPTGQGASAAVTTTEANISLTTSWQFFSVTISLPSISGKTIIGSSHYLAATLTPVATTFNFSIAQLQIEEGSRETSFEDRPVAIELPLCQMFYEHNFDVDPTGYGLDSAATTVQDETNGLFLQQSVPYRVLKRHDPTVTIYSADSGVSNFVYEVGADVDRSFFFDDAGSRWRTPSVKVIPVVPTAVRLFKWHFTAEAEL